MPWKAAKNKVFQQVCFFLPQLASATALKQLDWAGCWLSKQTNATSTAISDMVTDVRSVRHATLQNRAETDLPLLARGMVVRNLKDCAV